MYMSAVVVGIERGHCRHRQAARAKVGDNVVQILDAITCRGSWGYAGPWRARRVALIRPAVLVPPRRHEDDLVDGVGVEKAKHRVKVRTRQHVGVFLGEVAPAAAAVWLIAEAAGIVHDIAQAEVPHEGSRPMPYCSRPSEGVLKCRLG